MFDPERYFGGLADLIANRASWAETDGPTLKVSYDQKRNWETILWRCEVKFPSGERLIAFESHSYKRNAHYRKIKYRFMQSDGTMIFQVDPHTQPIPFEETPHLHKGPTEKLRLHDGEWALNGLSLKGFDFFAMWDLVTKYLKDGSVPWRT